ncbi:hypothetical protein BVRB_7g163300 [Beta vulgaris subsp. vulgaris]|uniref:uncharacterized protein LOC104898865 n=1 Tax=Beta vulgaris subsp. vulgaris TaxID=3555 RepID=UPI00053FAA17|nr:uncharacterized protein LOC104898865 [Beta vulgaris subsp. vulgaris]KMT06161.1 hypothetical protein BVRB_7g163300 [Beta vulgaris subsp. vulgaris]
MAKSLRSKREKRLRAIRREIVEPFYEKKDAAKLAAQEAAMAAPKLPTRTTTTTSMDLTSSAPPSSSNAMDVDMADRSQGIGHLKPVGGVGKKLKKKLKIGKAKNRGNGKIRRKHI